MLTTVPEVPQPDVDLDSTIAKFRPLADWFANRIQWCEDDHEDLVQEGILEFVKTLRGYQKSGRPIQDVKALAGVCFSAAMKWWYKKSDRLLEFTSIHDLSLPVDNIEIYFGEIYIEQYLTELGRVHGQVARLIATNLLFPSEEVGAVVMQYMSEKKALHAQGHRVVGQTTTRVQKQHIRQAIGLDTTEWDKTLIKIKQFTREFVCRDREGGSGHSKRESPVPRPS